MAQASASRTGRDYVGAPGRGPRIRGQAPDGVDDTQKDVRAGKVHDNSPMSIPRGVSRTRDGTLTVGSIHGTINCAAGFGALAG
jgi:hypothetical protein